MNYAVIFTYSFDGEVVVYLFATYDEALKFLKGSYEEELRIDTEENGWDSHGCFDEEEGVAYIFTCFNDHIDKTTMMIGNIYN